MSNKQRASLGHLLMEWRWMPELGSFYTGYSAMKRMAPKGYGEAVLVLPGFTAGDWTTRPLRRFLKDIGYTAYGWGLGTNTGPTPELIAKMEDLLDRLYRAHGKVTIIGHSLGGIYARDLARRHPKKVYQVMSLGSPYGADRDHVPALLVSLMERWTGKTIEELHDEAYMGPDVPPEVPCTSVFSRTDGIAHWSLCVDDPSPIHQNVEVYGSHTGMVVNLAVVWLIADRLAQPRSRWRKFMRPRGAGADVYPHVS